MTAALSREADIGALTVALENFVSVKLQEMRIWMKSRIFGQVDHPTLI
jgi:hypothetical protein